MVILRAFVKAAKGVIMVLLRANTEDVNSLSPTAFDEAGNGVMMVVPMQ